jgi:GMP synthase (glutamine-hydrolysing)
MKEIKTDELDPEEFIKEKVDEIRQKVGNKIAILALSGGVDSGTIARLGLMALGHNQLKIFFIDNGLMRKDEPEWVFSTFSKEGIPVQIIDAKKEFFAALKGITEPEAKREAITQAFYKVVLPRLIRETDAEFLFHGTILTDIEETVAGIKRQHNILEQIGIDTEKEFGYKLVEPLKQLRKDGVRKVAETLRLPKSIWNRMPFPGPALAARVIGEATPERIEIVRQATAIVEEELKRENAFQCMAILHNDKVTGIQKGKREFGLQIEVRCWDSKDARTATPTKLPYDIIEKLVQRITTEVPSVVSVVENKTPKPPSTMEAI